MRHLFAAVALLASALPALANDTTAELGTGGLMFTRSDSIEMMSEDLFISQEQVRVAYNFRNTAEATVDTIVAFPMPDIEASPYVNIALPESGDNFLGFTVTMDGQALTPQLEQRALAAGIDVSADLRAKGVPLFPYDDAVDTTVAALSEDIRKDWIARGIIVVETYDNGSGSGMVDHYTATWTLKSTYWWRASFEPGKIVDVRHTYKPSVGGTVGLNFVSDGKIGGGMLERYRTTYCIDKAFESAVQKAVTAARDQNTPYLENWIEYILTTGGNWRSNIGQFKLTIDKGKPENLVSFCGENVRKVGPTTFEMTAEGFYPEEDLDILILTKPDAQ